MSEIIGSVYEYMERTGHKKGILFIDEINCVSETLAPTILQFLQFKTFGTHKVPDGWIIAAAGNPSEYNASVRELDMAALDRVRLIHVEADFGVWETYAQKRQVHPAILSYLAMHPESFYRVELTREKRQFVTARGWEDLSRTLKEYERQELQVTDAFMEEFLRCPQIAADFSTYYRLYQATAGAWKIPEYLKGTLTAKERAALLEQWKNAGAEERCMAVRHLLAAASRWMSDLGRESRYLKREKEVLEQSGDGCRDKDFCRIFCRSGAGAPDQKGTWHLRKLGRKAGNPCGSGTERLSVRAADDRTADIGADTQGAGRAGSKAGRTGQSTYQNNGRSEKCIRRRSGAGRLAGRNPGTRRL